MVIQPLSTRLTKPNFFSKKQWLPSFRENQNKKPRAIRTGQYWVVKIDHGGAYHLAKNMRKFRFEVKWEGNFPENLRRNTETTK